MRRRDYFAIDRHKLAYLNAIEKFNCLFCSYTNGLIGYVREIAARTEAVLVPDPSRPPRARCSRTLRHHSPPTATRRPTGNG